MSVVPEIIIQKALVGGFQALKADTRLMDTLFQNVSQQMLFDMKEYILKTPIDFAVNYPKKGQLNTPAIVLILRSEGEAETFLGDFMGVSGDFGVVEQDMMVDTETNSGGSTSGLDGLGTPLVQGLTVDNSTGSTVTISTTSLTEYRECAYLELLSGACHQLVVVAGTGIGQTYNILSVSNNSLDIDQPFTIDLDISSVVDIRRVGEVHTEGEPSRVFKSNETLERIGVHYDAQYQLQILAGHQDEVIYLYSIVKALLLSQRPFLEGQGMMVFKLSGSDFAPRGEYLPSDVFMRVLNIQFTYPFEFYRSLEVANSLEICITPDELGSPGTGTPILISQITIK